MLTEADKRVIRETDSACQAVSRILARQNLTVAVLRALGAIVDAHWVRMGEVDWRFICEGLPEAKASKARSSMTHGLQCVIGARIAAVENPL